MAEIVETAINEFRNAIATVPGLKRVYTDPPESISEFPCAVVYLKSGEMTENAPCFHDFVADIYHARQVLPQAVNEAKVWPDRVLYALKANFRLNGSIEHIVYPIRYESAALQYNDMTHYGVRFRVRVKIFDLA